MTTPTNWPNPEKPYVPMFPERSGWHLITIYSRPTNGIAPHGVPTLMWWDAENKGWRIMPTGRMQDLAKEDKTDKLSYVGPVLTRTQINEMLVAERERCAVECDKLASEFLPCHTSEYASAIRNLGDAP